jgi:hypothetical protein
MLQMFRSEKGTIIQTRTIRPGVPGNRDVPEPSVSLVNWRAKLCRADDRTRPTLLRGIMAGPPASPFRFDGVAVKDGHPFRGIINDAALEWVRNREGDL